MLNRDLVDGLNVALNEATLRSVAVDAQARVATVRFEVLALDDAGAAVDDPVVDLRLSGLSRVAASLRHGMWNDESAPIEPIPLTGLAEAVRAIAGLPIYGWDFLDPAEGSWPRWRDRLSLDEQFAPVGSAHVLELFQEGYLPTRHLDLRLWFEDLTVLDRAGTVRPAADVAAAGVRWWDGLHAGNPATQGHGIVPG